MKATYDRYQEMTTMPLSELEKSLIAENKLLVQQCHDMNDDLVRLESMLHSCDHVLELAARRFDTNPEAPEYKRVLRQYSEALIAWIKKREQFKDSFATKYPEKFEVKVQAATDIGLNVSEADKQVILASTPQTQFGEELAEHLVEQTQHLNRYCARCQRLESEGVQFHDNSGICSYCSEVVETTAKCSEKEQKAIEVLFSKFGQNSTFSIWDAAKALMQKEPDARATMEKLCMFQVAMRIAGATERYRMKAIPSLEAVWGFKLPIQQGKQL